MKCVGVLWRVALLCLAVIVSVVVENRWIIRALKQQEAAGLRMLAGAVVPLLEKAHRRNDDLALFEVVGGLSKAPGITKAKVLRLDEPVPAGGNDFLVPLYDEGIRWGWLAIGRSFRVTRKARAKHLMFLCLGMGFWGATLAFFIERLRNIRRASEQSARELAQLLESERRGRSHAQSRLSQVEVEYSMALDWVVDCLARPMLLLDSSQRVMAISPEALRVLGGESKSSFLRKSWLEIPALSGSGNLIERALSKPGEWIAGQAPRNGVTLTAYACRMNESGSWVGISVE